MLLKKIYIQYQWFTWLRRALTLGVLVAVISTLNPLQGHAAESFPTFAPQKEEFSLPLQALASAAIQGALSDTEPLAAGLLASTSRGYHYQIYFLLGYARERSGNYQAALDAYQESLHLRATYLKSMFRAGLVLKHLGRCKESVLQMKEVHWRKAAGQPQALYIAAQCLITLGHQQEALSYLQTAYQLAVDYTPVVKLLIQTNYELLKNENDPALRAQLRQQLINDLNRITAEDPTDRESALLLAQLLLEQADPILHAPRIDQASSIAKRIVEQSNYSDENAVRLLANIYLKRRDLSSAQAVITRGLEINPQSESLQTAKKQLELELSLLEQATATANGTTR